MDIVLLVLLLIANTVMAHRIGQLRPVKNYPPQYELTPARQHRLVRTWVEPLPEDGGYPGWRFLCTCGTSGMSTNISERVLGSEQNAVKQFSSHAALYASVDEDGWKHKHDALRAEFDAYIRACYCRQTNDELINYRGQ